MSQFYIAFRRFKKDKKKEALEFFLTITVLGASDYDNALENFSFLAFF